MEADFSGYATKANLKCSDGRTIMGGAFKHQDKAKVPLVWQHGHSDPENVLGHAILEAREDGVFAYGFFNKTPKADHARSLVEHGDINMLSIWANELVERSKNVLHGKIREVSLVLSGANPGALIEQVSIRHSDGTETDLDDEAIIYTGLEFEHADDSDNGDDSDSDSDMTVQEVYNSMTDDQKSVLHYMVTQALEESGGELKQDNVGDDDGDDTDNDEEGTEDMKHNVFEKDGEGTDAHVLSHDDVQGIVADATKSGSLKDAVENYALAHGIENIDVLFPEAQALTRAPEWDSRRMEWVSGVLSGVAKSPFSRVKTWTADITFEEARAKGYVKGDMKKEEFFSVAKRETTPQTIYKKQKLDRDDIIDITDFDVVAWMKGEMRLMLDEELARAILVGDGRDVSDEDKIKEANIRPIASDDPFYTVQIGVNLSDANSDIREMVDAIILNRQYYKGTGMPTMFTTENVIAQLLTVRNTDGRREYKSLSEVAAELRVKAIIPVEVMEDDPSVVAILVNLADYTVGADKGGNVSMFDDFDIDYNQYKYLIETRVSGALTKPKSAMVIYDTPLGTDTAVVPEAPAWDPDTWTVTIPTVAGVSYFDSEGNELADAADIVLTAGQVLNVRAFPDSTYYFETGKVSWSFLRPTGT